MKLLHLSPNKIKKFLTLWTMSHTLQKKTRLKKSRVNKGTLHRKGTGIQVQVPLRCVAWNRLPLPKVLKVCIDALEIISPCGRLVCLTLGDPIYINGFLFYPYKWPKIHGVTGVIASIS